MSHSIKVRKLKRITLNIRSSKYPDLAAVGQAVVEDIGLERFYFFSAQKFPAEEDFEVTCEYKGEQYYFIVSLLHIHEQISSGKIMNAIPEEGKPFPARVFYRCFAKVKSRKVLSKANELRNVHEIKPEDALASAMKSVEEISATPPEVPALPEAA